MTNKVLLTGFMAADAETKTVTSGRQVCNFRMATEDTFGEKKVTDWHNIVAWGAVACIASPLRKGTLVTVVGRLTTRSYEDKAGTKKYVTEVNAEMVLPEKTRQSPAENGEPMSQESVPF